MEVITRPGFGLLNSRYPRPRSSMYPGVNDSMTKSAFSARRRKRSRPSGCSMLRVMPLLLVLKAHQ